LLEVLNKIYSRNPKEKLIIFTQFVDTLKYLKDLLKTQNNDYFIEIFFGGLDRDQKDEAVERFRNNQNYSILISTEIGAEGRNFQFCWTLINYDLPWNPMKLEQRIGRLDRIGQESREIYIYNFYMEGTVETDVVYALLRRINLFEESVGVLEPIIGRIEKDLKNVIFAEDDRKKRKKLNEFYRTLDEEIQKAKEIEMQLDDLMIDKKSFQMESLISSLASCIDVKLTHNELYLLITYFLNLNSNKYGILENLKEKVDGSRIINHFLSKILLNEELLKGHKYKLLNEYIGTFNLDFARKREEFDFFALGHPLINTILNFCMNDSFKGTYTILNLKRKSLPANIFPVILQQNEFYLFVFTVKFQGYIIETQILPVLVDKDGREVKELQDFVLNMENYENIFEFNDYPTSLNNKTETIPNLQVQAKKIAKSKTSLWKREIKKLNDKIFTIEQEKKKRIYAYNRRVLKFKIESLNQRLERNKNKRPTRRQLRNINGLIDEIKKQERLQEIQKLEEEIRFNEKDIQKNNKKLDDLSFEYEDLKNEMNRRNLAKFYTNLLSLAIIRIEGST